jgi:hypothetical protein
MRYECPTSIAVIVAPKARAETTPLSAQNPL